MESGDMPSDHENRTIRASNASTSANRSRHEAIHPQQHEMMGHAITECELRRVQFELAEASKVAAIEALVASITHEMSQPLSAIDASSSAGLRWLQRDTPNFDEAIISLEKVRSCAIRARKIIDDLRLLTSRSTMPAGIFDIHAAIGEVVVLSRPRIDETGARIVFTDMANPLQVPGDRVQIQQVIENLIVNALEAMTDVVDRERIIHLSSAQRDDDSIVISVADSGPGLAAGSEETVFRPFVTTKPQSIGMGLPICKRIIEAHGGTLWVEQLNPFGARFSFILDRVRADEELR
jgi:C4-dicarboxylate-specific signal transduction histidine kinase